MLTNTLFVKPAKCIDFIENSKATAMSLVVYPTIQATNISFSNYENTSFTVSWTRGNGTGCAVFIKQTSTLSPTVTDNTYYGPNSGFGLSSLVAGAGWYCIYDGVGSTVNVTGLTKNTAYRVMVCEYFGGNSTEAYLKITNATNPKNQSSANKTDQVITFNAIPGVNYGIADFAPGATISSGKTITYTSSNPLVATIISSKIHIVGAGVSNITASQAGVAGMTGYNPAVDVTQQLTVMQAVQTISSSVLANKIYGTADFDPLITSSSGLQVTYSSSNSSFATIIGNFIHIAGAGIDTIFCSQAGNANYLPASIVIKPFTITKAAQTFTFNLIPTKFYGDVDFDPNATINTGLPIIYSSGNTSYATIVNNQVHIVGVGTTTITATQQGNANYNLATKSQTLKISKGNQTITFPITTFGFTTVDFSPAIASSNLPVTYTSSDNNIATIVNNKVHMKALGTVTITATQAGNSLYVAATPVPQILTFVRGNQTINFPVIPPLPYSNMDFNPATASSNLTISYSSNNPAVAAIISGKLHIMGIGSAVITANQSGNSFYFPAAPAVQNLTVIVSSQTITFPPMLTQLFGNPDFDPGATVNTNLQITYISDNISVAQIVNNKIHIVGRGTANITATQAGNANATAATPVSQILNVTTSTQAIVFAPIANKYYGNADFDPGAYATSGLPVYYSIDNPLVATFVNGKIHITGVGTTSITCSQSGNADNYPADNIVQSLTVLRGSQSINLPVLNDVKCGDPNIFPGATATSSLPVTYTSSNTSVAVILGNQIHIVGSGTTTITALQSGNANYNPAPNVSTLLTVNKSDQLITFDPIAPIDYEDIYLNPAISNANLPIEYSSSNTNVAVIINGSIHVVGSGTAEITAMQSGNMNFFPAVPVSKILTINKISQTISFEILPNKIFGDADFSISAASTSNLPVTFSSSNTAVATVIGNIVHILSAGNTIITAQQSGNDTYLEAIAVTNILSITSQTQEINFPSFQIYKYGDADIPLNATATSGYPVSYFSDNINVAVIIGNNIQIVGPGIANITAKQSGDINYQPAGDVSNIFIVNKSSQTITFNALSSVVYGASDVTLSATSSSGLPVTYISDNSNVVTIIAGKMHFVNAGTANIIAMQDGDNVFDAASNVSNVIIVNNTSQSITFPPLFNMTYGDPDQNFSATATSGLTVSFLNKYPGIATIINGKIHILQAGIDTIVASQAGNGTFTSATSIPRSFVIQKASQTITFNTIPSQPKIFGGANFTLNATGGNSNNIITYSSSNTLVATVSGNIVTILGTGTTILTASQIGNINYNDAIPVTQTLTVNKATNTIIFNPIDQKTFNDPDFDPLATSLTGLPVIYTSSDPAVAIVIGNNIHIVGAGISTITASQAGDINYGVAANKSQILFVNKELQIITFDQLATYNLGDPDFDPNAIASSGLPILYTSDNLNVATIINGKVHITGGGTCIITATQPGNNNVEEASFVQQSLVVNGATQTITFNTIGSRPYGGADITLLATSTSGLQVTYTIDNPDIATIIATSNGYSIHLTGVGTANIQAEQIGNSDFKPALPITQVLTVIQGNQTINFPAINLKTYGDKDFSVFASVISGLPLTLTSSNDTIAQIVDGMVRIISAGSVNIIASQVGDDNYKTANSVSRVLTIQKLAQNIIFPDIKAVTYGDEDFDPGAHTKPDINIVYKSSNTDIASISFDGFTYLVHIKKAGTCTITASQPGNKNYLPANNNISKVLMINKAPLTVTADNFSKSFGTENPKFTAWYTGFQNGDDFSNFGQSPVILTSATNDSPVGSYDIVPTGGISENYRFIYINGTLTIGASIPEKPEKPVGPTLLCINPDNQVYQLNGTSTASTYNWSITPTNAGIITGTGKIADLKFNKSFSGKAGISAIGENPSGKGISSDTLFITVLAMPDVPDVIYNSTYCKSNENADSIVISNSQKGYLYQLILNNSYLGVSIAGTGGRLGWYNVLYGTYTIDELYCKTNIAKDILIKEVNSVAKKPTLQLKWNDVIVCNNSSDSIINYQWYQDGQAITDANLQYLWTQKKMGKYYVYITDLEGCQTNSDTISINTAPALVYPNPNSGQFKVTFTNTENGRVTVNVYKINSLPLKTYTFTKNIDDFEQDIDLNKVDSGIYFIELNINDKRLLYEKLIIQ